MYNCLHGEIKNGFYQKLYQNLSQKLTDMTARIEKSLEKSVKEILRPVRAVHHKLFEHDQLLFAVTPETRKLAQGIIEQVIQKMELLIEKIQGSSVES